MMRRLAARFVVVLIALAVNLVALSLTPTAHADIVKYPADGLLRPGAVFQEEHPDQGKDFVTDWKGVVQAPGSGCVVGFGSDRAFPNGFGPLFVLMRIDSGPYRSPSPYYIGHTSAILHPGEYDTVNNGGDWCFKFGTPLARADQGRPSWICPDLSNCEGYRITVDGGWVEFGQQEPSGALGPYSSTGHWYDSLLLQTLSVGSDPLLIFPTTKVSSPYGPLVERRLILEYLGARAHPVKYRNYLKYVLEPRLKYTADRIAWLAKHVWGSPQHANWTLNTGGSRFQYEVKASSGRVIGLR